MTLRPIRRDDGPALAAIHAECFDRPWSAEDLASMASEGGAVAILAEVRGAALGFVLCRRLMDEAEVLTLAVSPGARGGGLGAALMEEACTLCAAAGAVSLWLEVAQTNLAALALYRRLGFIEAGRRRGYYARPGGAVDALVLRRALNCCAALNSRGSTSYPPLKSTGDGPSWTASRNSAPTRACV